MTLASATNLHVEAGASLQTLAMDKLRLAISDGSIAPGTKLVERDLGAALGVSRTVVREILARLAVEGYLTETPRRGRVVSTLDFATVRSIYEAREAIEAKAAGLFVVRATDEDRASVRSTIDQLVEQEKEGEHVLVLTLVRLLIAQMCIGSGNTLFRVLLEPMAGRVHMLQTRAAKSVERRAEALGQLVDLAQALLGNDPQAAEAAARTRLRGAARFAINHLFPS